MPRIKTDSLQEGMVVANDVKNIDNMLLIPSGCNLTERQIDILQAWGVAEIDIQSTSAVEDADPLAKLSPEEVAKLTDEVRSRFWQPDDANPVFAEIFALILRRRAYKACLK
jgi:hypothetical protein